MNNKISRAEATLNEKKYPLCFLRNWQELGGGNLLKFCSLSRYRFEACLDGGGDEAQAHTKCTQVKHETVVVRSTWVYILEMLSSLGPYHGSWVSSDPTSPWCPRSGLLSTLPRAHEGLREKQCRNHSFPKGSLPMVTGASQRHSGKSTMDAISR